MIPAPVCCSLFILRRVYDPLYSAAQLDKAASMAIDADEG
jgi:hypothetical protein